MDERIVFAPSAFKHGVSEEDIRNAFKIRLFDHPMPGEENKNLLIGISRSGIALEILYNELDNNRIKVFHAMKCRKAYRDFFGF
ncbi:MAG: hypothetical protein LBG73_04915 [Spirochaetaceae bacterium]|jgi:hypothetical protein|nr:hypothetical protein [Spirochaetaceae bacterium]